MTLVIFLFILYFVHFFPFSVLVIITIQGILTGSFLSTQICSDWYFMKSSLCFAKRAISFHRKIFLLYKYFCSRNSIDISFILVTSVIMPFNSVNLYLWWYKKRFPALVIQKHLCNIVTSMTLPLKSSALLWCFMYRQDPFLYNFIIFRVQKKTYDFCRNSIPKHILWVEGSLIKVKLFSATSKIFAKLNILWTSSSWVLLHILSFPEYQEDIVEFIYLMLLHHFPVQVKNSMLLEISKRVHSILISNQQWSYLFQFVWLFDFKLKNNLLMIVTNVYANHFFCCWSSICYLDSFSIWP